ncbi:MAG: hypothetical protein ACD_33C00002G0038 [uncultured bacterium]|nr:MAG: hypothetical protein ACD_33C00002G0038 [uncultured bacterium]
MLKDYIVNDSSINNYQQLNDTMLYMDYLNAEYTNIIAKPDDAYRYQGNLFALFNELNISSKLHVFTMHINGYTNPVQYKGDKLIFKVPNLNLINYLEKIYN